MHGLVVQVKPAPVGAIMSATRLAGLQDFNFSNVTSLDRETLETIGEVSKLFQIFADSLIEWNLDDDDGNPVPPTIEGIKREDGAFIMDIIRAWTSTSSDVTENLGQPSNGGSRSEVALIPMETFSGSLLNS